MIYYISIYNNSTKYSDKWVYTIFGDRMKKKIKKVVIPIFLSVVCGTICGRLMFSIYEEKGSNILSSNIIYLLEDSTYEDIDTMKANTISTDYIYYQDNGKYNAVVAMTKNKDNIDKIKKVYDKELNVETYTLNDDDINTLINDYDTKLSNTENNDEIKQIIGEMINIYKDREDIKMAKIS